MNDRQTTILYRYSDILTYNDNIVDYVDIENLYQHFDILTYIDIIDININILYYIIFISESCAEKDAVSNY